MADGPAQKVCARCGFKSSAAKKYCDGCGAELAGPAGPDAPLRGVPDAVIPQTVIKRLPKQEPPVPSPETTGFSLPQAGRSQQTFGAPAKPAAGPKTSSTSTVKPPRAGPSLLDRLQDFASEAIGRLGYFIKSVLALLFLAALGLAGLIVFQQHRAASRPEVAIMQAVELQLERMRIGDFETAHKMFTPSAQGMTTLDELRQSRDPREWRWSNPKIVALEPGMALIEYDYQAAGAQAEKDYMYLEKHGKEWLRPYNWSLLQSAETALRTNAPDIAVLKAQAAAHVNPRDPLARAYLCESFYFRRLVAEADRECREALAAAARHPSKVRGRTLRHLKAVLADSARAMGKTADALALYDELLAVPDLPRQERCDALRARSTVQPSAQDVAEANRLCPESAQ